MPLWLPAYQVKWRHRPLAPTDRYELWPRAPDGTECKFTVRTREMPARRRHEVRLITTTHRRPRGLTLANWTKIDGVNCARSEPPGLVQVGELPWLCVCFVGMEAWLGDGGMVLIVPAAGVVLAAVAAARWVARQRVAWRVDRRSTWRRARRQSGRCHCTETPANSVSTGIVQKLPRPKKMMCKNI